MTARETNPREPRALKDEALPCVRAAQLDDAAKLPRWLIDNLWLASGVGVIGGTPKSLKTWCGLDMAVSVATGTPCLGRFAVAQPGPALIYLAEDRLCDVRERLAALCTARGLLLDNLDVHVITTPTLQLDCADDICRLGHTVATLRPKMMLLDPFVRLVHLADENSAQDVAAVLAVLRRLQREHDLAIIVTHHTRKNGRTRQHGQALRGSGDFHAWLDSGLYLTHERSALRLTVEHRAAAAPESVFIRLTGQPPRVVIVDPERSGQEVVAPTLDARIVAALSAAQAPVRRSQLRQQLAVNNARLGESLTRLQGLGRICLTPDGWRLQAA